MQEIKNYTMNFGPQHPATHTTLRLVLVHIVKNQFGRRHARVSCCWWGRLPVKGGLH